MAAFIRQEGPTSSIAYLPWAFLALRNAQPTRYAWNAKGEDFLNKIQLAREAMASQTGG